MNPLFCDMHLQDEEQNRFTSLVLIFIQYMSKLNHLPNSKEGDISKFILNSFQCVGEENKTKGNVD